MLNCVKLAEREMWRKHRMPMTARSPLRGHKPVDAAHKPKSSWDSYFAKLNTTVSFQNKKADRNGEIIIYFPSCSNLNLKSLTQKEHKPISSFSSCCRSRRNKTTRAWAVCCVTYKNKLSSSSSWPIFSIRMEGKMPSAIGLGKYSG